LSELRKAMALRFSEVFSADEAQVRGHALLVAEWLEESGGYNHEMPEKNPQPSDPLRLNPEPVPKPQPEPAPPDTDKTEKKKRPKRKKRG
jgi:hypothetical protein